MDRNAYGGILLYIREDILPQYLNQSNFYDDMEAFFVEINIRKKKWLIGSSYNPHKNLIRKHLNSLARQIGFNSSKHGNILFIGDFNAEHLRGHYGGALQ